MLNTNSGADSSDSNENEPEPRAAGLGFTASGVRSGGRRSLDLGKFWLVQKSCRNFFKCLKSISEDSKHF